MNILKKMIEFIKLKIAVLTTQLKIKLLEEKDFKAFANALGERESSNNYQAVNAFGYLGRWQFGMARLCDLGYTERKEGYSGYSNSAFRWKSGYSQDWFLNNPDIQDRIFLKHCRKLAEIIKRNFGQSLGFKVNGIQITLSGLIAGAHLGGIGGVSKFLDRRDTKDQLGTSVSDYVKKFAGYNLENM